MHSRQSRLLLSFAVLCALAAGYPSVFFAETALPDSALSQSARTVLSSAFGQSDSQKVIEALVAGASKQTAPYDRKAILAALAGYEERIGLPLQAAKHYSEASYTDVATRDFSLLLDAARACLAANDFDQANGLVRAVLVSCFDDAVLLRARVYAVYAQLASGDRTGALSQLRACAGNPVFAEYIPSLLFTLWWADSDSAAKKRLLDQFPASPEAQVARGEVGLSRSPYWFLMGRNDGDIAAFARAGSAAVALSSAVEPTKTDDHQTDASLAQELSAAVTSSLPAQGYSPASSNTVPGKVWQQVGFFKNKDYADELVGKLTKLGFSPHVRTDRRPSGTVYYAVIVAEDDERSAGSRLKDAGFESCLVFD